MQNQQRPRKHWLLVFAVLSVLLCAITWALSAKRDPDSSSTSAEIQAADGFQRKLDYIQENAKHQPPDERPTVFREDEINAYFAQRRLKIPEGVKSVRFQLQPEKVTAVTRVDFEEITKAHPSWNPMLMLFTGIHDAEVVAHAQGGGGLVRVHVDSVTLDGVNVPRIALEMFIEKFVQPKFPKVRLDGEYRLPAKLDMVAIEQQEGVASQK